MTEKILDPVKETLRTKPPGMYSLMVHNDDFTPFEFVMDVLKQVCGLTEEQAFQVTKSVHQTGKGQAGIYTKDIAETKQTYIMDAAQKEEHPLQVSVEPAA